jgi:small-conductance mechanosensitive channel
VPFRPLLLVLVALLSGPALAQEGDGFDPATDRATVYFDAVPLFEVRGVSAVPAAERAGIIRGRLRAAAEDPGFDPATIAVAPAEDGLAIAAPGRPLLTVFPSDARLEEVSQHVLARVLRDRVAQAITDYRAARTPEGVRSAVRHAVGWTIGYLVALAALVAIARIVLAFVDRHVTAQILVWEERARSVVQLRTIWEVVRAVLRAGFVVLGLVATYVWLDAVLLALPWTRDAGRAALAAVSSPVRRIAGGIAGAIPNVIAIVVIAVLTVELLRFLRRLFAMIAAGNVRIAGFDPEWAVPTERILRLLVIVFAAVMAYPYVPGSSTEAFKAVGIFLGLVFSFGASSIVANLVAGQSLIYRRAFRVGDRVEIAGVTGDVEELGAQATYLRTPRNERVTIPNAIVLTTQVTNYSHFARDPGLILHTEVGIGYEVPWQEVEAMLVEAARRTPGVLAEPAPFVWQKKLGDFSPIYELNVSTRDARAMHATLTALHAAIQDVFAERGIQIMTPSYVADPPDPKVPPSARPV